MPPTVITKNVLVAHLRQMADLIEADDSFEGSLEYYIREDGMFDVQAAYRCGNLNGQGGMILIGKDE